MTKGRWILISVVAFVVQTIINFLGHGVVMTKSYEATVHLWRPVAEMNRLLPLGYLATLIVSFILVYIYHKGYEGKTGKIAEGARFGLVMGLFAAVPMSLWSYVTSPITVSMAVGYFFIGLAEIFVAGIIIGLMYKRAV